MAAVGFSELLLMLALVGFDDGRNDIVSLIPPREYFTARKLEPTIDKLLALAGEPPTSGARQIAQLLALRQLADDAAAVKKSPRAGDIRAVLQQIAAGKKANDPTGFAADYAKRALAAIDGGKHEPRAVAGWKEGLAWIPDNVTLLGGVDSRGAPVGRKAPDLAPLFAVIPKEAKTHMFDMIDKLGNIRVDRLVFGFRELPNQEFEYFVRATGKLNPKWMADLVRAAQVKIEERAATTGPIYRIIRPLAPNGKAPAMALVGDSEFLLAGADSAAPRQPGAVMAEAVLVHGAGNRDIALC
ncbi:MAG: hypothetical protein FJ271_20600 [Planctomycetes bacterium]|nr:hypothetical protein [Planctomycetota bacterium]